MEIKKILEELPLVNPNKVKEIMKFEEELNMNNDENMKETIYRSVRNINMKLNQMDEYEMQNNKTNTTVQNESFSNDRMNFN
jgi:uncharacterized protein YaaR (DUF327 family)